MGKTCQIERFYLKVELSKLKETADTNTANFQFKNKKMLQLLHELKLDYLIEDENVKKRIR